MLAVMHRTVAVRPVHMRVCVCVYNYSLIYDFVNGQKIMRVCVCAVRVYFILYITLLF